MRYLISTTAVFAALFSATAAAQSPEETDYYVPEPDTATPSVTTSQSTPVDIALIYTQGMEDNFGLGLRAHINEHMDLFHNALIAVGRTGGARLVGLRSTNYIDDYYTDHRECLDGGDPHFDPRIGTGEPCSSPLFAGGLWDLKDEVNHPVRGDLSWVSGWRDGTGADLLGLSRYFMPSHEGLCGVSQLPDFLSHSRSSDELYGFVLASQTSGQCSYPSILAHEVGHSFGLLHDGALEGGIEFFAPLYSGYGRGYAVNEGLSNEYNTIMVAMANEPGKLSFSDPTVNCPFPATSSVCGVLQNYTVGQPPPPPASIIVGNNSAQALREDRGGVTEYRDFTAGTRLVSSVIPSARGVTMGSNTTVTYFASVHNIHGTAALGCAVELPGGNSAFGYQTADANLQPVGPANTEFTIPANSAQNLILSFTPRTPLDDNLSGQALDFEFFCDNRRSAAITPGVNNTYLTTSLASNPIADIATFGPQKSFITPAYPHVVGGADVEAFATVNYGASGNITVSVVDPQDFTEIGSSVDLPVTLRVCETNFITGLCLGAWSTGSLTTYISANQLRTFAIAVTATGSIAKAPASRRVFLIFRDSAGRLVGASSLAICTLDNAGCVNE